MLGNECEGATLCRARTTSPLRRGTFAGVVVGGLATAALLGCAGSEEIHILGTPQGVSPEPIEMGLPPEPGRYGEAIRVQHYEVELVIPTENDWMEGRTRVHYRSALAGPHTVTLDLTGVAVDTLLWEGVPISYSYQNGEISFEAPGSEATEDVFVVEVATSGSPDDGLILRESVHGDPVAFSDNWPNRARFWFPSMDHPSQKATVSFTVHLPEGRSVISNGTLTEANWPTEPASVGGRDGFVTWRWRTGVPIPTYLMVIGAARFEVIDGGLAACGRAPNSPRQDGCIEVSHWVFAPDTAHAREVFARTARMVDYYVDLVGPYPFEKLANVQSATRFGGMENASAIFYSERALAQGRNIEGTVAHEVAHKWFGNSVTPADWPHLWLSEGFASYFGPLFFGAEDGEEAFRSRLAGSRERYLNSDVTHRPVVDRSAESLLDLLNPNSYQKGALVLHMLRGIMGDEAFFGGVQEYYARFAGGNAVTDDLREVMEAAHGEPLGWFFQQWLMEPGYPVLRVEWEWDAAAGELELRVAQEQDEGWPTFRFPLEFELEFPGRTQRVTEWVEGREWTHRIALSAPPSDLRIDPDGWVLHRQVEG